MTKEILEQITQDIEDTKKILETNFKELNTLELNPFCKTLYENFKIKI